MSQNEAKALTYEALSMIKSALNNSEEPIDFLAEADRIIGQEENCLPLSVGLGPVPLLSFEKKPGVEGENATILYEYLGASDLANAADSRLWTFLAFSTFRPYMENRWSLTNIRGWKKRVSTRWLLLNPTRGSLIRHGISRLWWVSSLTYDGTLNFPLSSQAIDPYAYTRAVFQNEDRINALFDRNSGALPHVVRAVLEHFAAPGMQGTDNEIRALLKELTLVYGYRDLAHLDEPQISALIREISDQSLTRSI